MPASARRMWLNGWNCSKTRKKIEHLMFMNTAVVRIPSSGHIYPHHPEDPVRFSKLDNWEIKPYAHKLIWINSTPADPSRIATVHSHTMIAEIEKACLQAPA